jgi:agmatinase
MVKYHFLEYDAENTHNPRAPFAVLPIPYERTVSFGRGTGKAPAAILKASMQAELFDEEFFCSRELKVQTLPAMDCRGPTAAVFNRIRRRAETILKARRFLMSFGGEHSLTIPLVAAAKSACGDISVLNLDSHLDLRDSFRNSRFSHACVFRRVMELGVPVVHAGIRSLCREEYELVKRNHLSVYWARDILAAKNDKWIRDIIRRLKKKVYLSIDADVLDPSIMPGTGTPEPGGLAWQTVLQLLRQVCRERKVIAADIVEVIPLTNTPLCEYVAAKLALKLMMYCSRKFQ